MALPFVLVSADGRIAGYYTLDSYGTRSDDIPHELVNSFACLAGGASIPAEPTTGFKSGCLVPPDSCPIDAAKRDCLGKEAITTRSRRAAADSFGKRLATTGGRSELKRVRLRHQLIWPVYDSGTSRSRQYCGRNGVY